MQTPAYGNQAVYAANPAHAVGQQPSPQPAYQQPAQPTPQPPAWQGKVALFPAAPGAKYQYSGNVSIPVEALPALLHYLQTTPPDERGNVKMHLLAFDNTSKAGLRYIGGFAQPMLPPQPQVASPAVQQQYVAHQQGQHQVAYAQSPQAQGHVQQAALPTYDQAQAAQQPPF